MTVSSELWDLRSRVGALATPRTILYVHTVSDAFSLIGRYRFSIAAGTAAAASGTVSDLPVVIRVTSLGHLEIGL